MVLAAIIAATTICTYIDRQNNTEGTLNYYKETVNDKSNGISCVFIYHCIIYQSINIRIFFLYLLALKWNIITAFSIPRNYYKLVQPAKNEIERDLRVAQGIRLFFLYFMVFSHATIGYAIEIVVNPEYYERVSTVVARLNLFTIFFLFF